MSAFEPKAQEAALVESEAIAIVNQTVAAARLIEVQTPEQARGAAEFLSRIADARKRNEQARLFIVGPLNTQVKKINGKFKENDSPLAEADKEVRAKLLAFREKEAAELAARQAEEDAARREREAAAEAERKRKAEEAARVEREAREAEERRQASLREAQNERAREIAVLGDDELAVLANGDDTDSRLAAQEIESRRAAEEAKERAEAARREAEEATQAAIAETSAPIVAAAAISLDSVSERKRWVATVIDESRVPREYLMVDTKKINAAVKDGVREIAGVKIEHTAELAVRAGR